MRDARTYDHAWQAYSRRYLRTHPICSCDAVRVWSSGGPAVVSFGPSGAVAPACHTDHVQPLNSGGAKYDPANHQPLCHSCHSKKTARFG
ncbi:HNH endonuclease [Luteolibacter arcticus]|uniref:HNH endonuclease n=1 Tax=Luteolibacter arcticus TaxID=1581411 RepID=UPI0034E0D715